MRRSLSGAAASLFCLVAVLGCSFDPQLPNARYQCAMTTHCPEGFSCVEVSGLYLKDGKRLSVCCRAGNCASGLDDGGVPKGGVIGRMDIAALDVDASAPAPASGGRAGDAAEGDVGDTGGQDGGGSGGGSGAGGSGGGTGGASGASGDAADGPPPDAATGDVHDAPICPVVCNIGDSRCGPNGGVQPCALSGTCYVWGQEIPCGPHAKCAGAPRAACACDPPPSGCMAAPGSFCSNAMTLETCAADGDSCIYKQTPRSCPAGKPCAGPYGSASCSCAAAPAACQNVTGTVCDGDASVVRCAYDANQCLAVSSTTPCIGGQRCAGAPGSATCRCPADPPECLGVKNGTVCMGNSVVSCSTTAQGCVMAAVTTTCTAAKPCGGPVGVADCVCPALPACGPTLANGSYCSANSVVTCSRNSDGCQQATSTACPDGRPCGGTHPTATCTCPAPPSQCLSNGAFVSGRVCRNGAAETCGTDVNACPAITGSTACVSPRTCQGALPNAICDCPAVPACSNGNGAQCANATTLVTCSDASGCQQATTTTCTMVAEEGCVGTSPTAKCEKAYGYAADLGSEGMVLTEFLFGVSVQVSAPLTLKRLGLIARAASGHVRMAIYTDNAGVPDTWKASAILSTQTVRAGRNEYVVNDLSSAPNVVLAAGRYWIFAVFEAATTLAQGSTTVPTRYSNGWSPWNTPFPAAPLSSTTPDSSNPAVNFYLVGIP